MNNDFPFLLEFLDRFEPEVTGRGLPNPAAEEAARLHRFASGQCDEKERAEVCALLHQHPTLLRWVAERVKMARATSGS